MANSRNRGEVSPVGSVVERNPDASLPRGDNSSYQVVGTGGRVRHTGEFDADNAAFQQLRVASNNKDKDALYERAINWEIEQAKLREQREYDESLRDEERAYAREVLEEQREYDSPIEQVARQRAAGINPDITGGSSSGSTSSGSSAQMQIPDTQSLAAPQLQSQTKFNNAYDNTSQVFEGINSAASLLSSLSGGFNSVLSGISQLKTLPSEIALNEANAGLANSNANEVNTLLDGNKKSLDLDNISKYMGHISNLQGLLTNGFTDEQGTQLFNTLGIPEEQQGQLMASIRGVHQNPELLAKFHNDNLNARKSQWKDKVYNDNTVEGFTQLAKQIEFDQLQFQYADAYLKANVINALMYDDDYSSNLVDTALNMASTDKVNSDIVYQNAVKDCEAWGQLWDQKKSVCDGLKLEVDKLKAKAEEDGKWTEEEIGNYTQAWIKYQACRGSLSNEFNQMRGFFIDVMQKRYERNKLLKNNGNMRSMDMIGAINYFSRINFDSDYEHLPGGGAIAREWLKTAGGFI